MKLKGALLGVAALLAFAPSFAHADLVPSGGDDSAAIQAAIDGAGSGGTVTLGAGTFLIGTQLTIGNGVTLVGKGRDETVLKYTGSEGSSGRVAKIQDYGILSSVTVTGGKVNGNNECGGGVQISGGGTVTWCCVTNNYAKKGAGGGIGVRGVGSTAVYDARIDHTIVANNACGTSTYENCGGGIGVYTTSSMCMNRIEIDTCLVCGNSVGGASKAGHGAGIGFDINCSAYNIMSTEVRNTTVVGNSATGTGGGVYFHFKPQSKSPDKGRVTLVNSVLANNQATVLDDVSSFADLAFKDGDVKNNVVGNISYCFFGLEAEAVGTGSSFGDPGFVDAANGDYHLSAAQKLGYETEEAILDLDGLERTGVLDVGCYASGGGVPLRPIVLDDPVARPSTNYNGNAVSVAFTGDFPDGAVVSAKITVGGVDYAGVVGEGVIDLAVPGSAVTAGNAYDATVTLVVGEKSYSKSVALVQGTPKVEEDDTWIAESASAFNTTGTWSGDRAEVASGKIAVSNATFTATGPSAAEAKVRVATTMVFNGPSDTELDPAARAGVQVVRAGGVNRYAFLTGDGIVTNATATANASGAVTVAFDLDYTKNEVVYTVGGAVFGPFAATAGAKSVSSVRYVGETSVTSLEGSYRYEGIDANLAMAGGDEYATVADAIIHAGQDAVTLLWDASWTPSAAGDYDVATNGHVLAIGGPLAYAVKDNGDGTITVMVSGGEEPDEPAAGSITIVGSTVKVAVSDVKADCWYALEKTTDLTKDFEVVPATCVSGAELLAGTGELEIAVGDGETQAFYRVVVSKTEFAK